MKGSEPEPERKTERQTDGKRTQEEDEDWGLWLTRAKTNFCAPKSSRTSHESHIFWQISTETILSCTSATADCKNMLFLIGLQVKCSTFIAAFQRCMSPWRYSYFILLLAYLPHAHNNFDINAGIFGGEDGEEKMLTGSEFGYCCHISRVKKKKNQLHTDITALWWHIVLIFKA